MHFNSFVSNTPFLYPLKTSENLRVFLCFQWAEKGWIRNKRVKQKILSSTKFRAFRKRNPYTMYITGTFQCEINFLDFQKREFYADIVITKTHQTG